MLSTNTNEQAESKLLQDSDDEERQELGRRAPVSQTSSSLSLTTVSWQLCFCAPFSLSHGAADATLAIIIQPTAAAARSITMCAGMGVLRCVENGAMVC